MSQITDISRAAALVLEAEEHLDEAYSLLADTMYQDSEDRGIPEDMYKLVSPMYDVIETTELDTAEAQKLLEMIEAMP